VSGGLSQRGLQFRFPLASNVAQLTLQLLCRFRLQPMTFEVRLLDFVCDTAIGVSIRFADRRLETPFPVLADCTQLSLQLFGGFGLQPMPLECRLFGFVSYAPIRVRRRFSQCLLQAVFEFLVRGAELGGPDLDRPRLSFLTRRLARVMMAFLQLTDLALQFGLQTRNNRVKRVAKLVV
jgi:hypothetical protein